MTRVSIFAPLFLLLTLALLSSTSCENRSGVKNKPVKPQSINPEITPQMQKKARFWENIQDGDARAAHNALLKGMEFYAALQQTPNWNTPGGYAWAYAPDLTRRAARHDLDQPTVARISAGEGPVVGSAFLRIFRTTGSKRALIFAQQVGNTLLENQMMNGGWGAWLFCDAEMRAAKARYLKCAQTRPAVSAGCCRAKGRMPALPPLPLKEGYTQKTVEYLINLGTVTEDSAYAKAAQEGLQFLLQAQHPCGGWPNAYPVVSREGFEPDQLVANQISLNDGATQSAIDAMLKAYEAYRDKTYLESALKGGDFLLRAQDATFGGWAQQYNPVTLKPSWGRGRVTVVDETTPAHYITHRDRDGAMAAAVEPPALYADRSSSVIMTLVGIFLLTGEERFLNAARKGRSFLERTRAGKEIWYELIELGTGRPFFVERRSGGHGGAVSYEPTNQLAAFLSVRGYETAAGAIILNHALYSSVSQPRLPPYAIAAVKYLQAVGKQEALHRIETPPVHELRERLEQLRPYVREIISVQRADGAWPDHGENRAHEGCFDAPEVAWAQPGTGAITTGAFDRHVRTLCEYLNVARLLSETD